MESNKRPVQVDRVLNYLRNYGSLTALEALRELGVMSFSKRVCELKNQGFYITTKWEKGIDRYGNKFRVKRYFLIEEKAE